jgi:Icc-related predicted phosphoesterase
VLVTHGPPFGILDLSPDQAERMGDPELRNRVRELPSLKLHAFGHVHGAHGAFEQDGVTFANVALIGNRPTLPLQSLHNAPASVPGAGCHSHVAHVRGS